MHEDLNILSKESYMFENLGLARPDPILALIGEYRNDTREGKIDLSVGVYRDDAGHTPIVCAVHQAEQRLLEQQTTKSYLGLTGNAEFNECMARLVLGDYQALDTVAMAQAPGGSGALRLLGELTRLANPKAAIWFSEPTWPNHHALFGAIGMECKNYPYFDAANQSVDFQALCAAIEDIPADDVIVLHGCCHNPTGSDMSVDQWQTLAALIEKKGIIPLIDVAYHGLGKELAEDIQGMNALIKTVPLAMISVSCSKNFGLYRDRVGCALVVTPSADMAAKLTGHLGVAGRRLYSMPPDHGAAVVANILTDENLTVSWKQELDTMRDRINGLRKGLASALNALSSSRDWDFIARQYGMFSVFGLDAEQLARLKQDYAIYAVNGGRINFAGMRDDTVQTVATALLAVKQS